MRVSGVRVPALFLVAALTFCVLPLSAQVDEPLPPIPPPEVMEEQAAPPPSLMEMQETPRALAVESNIPRRIETLTTTNADQVVGTKGEIYLSGPPVGLGGVFLSAIGTTHPDVALRLGTADSGSRFAVYPAGATAPVFTVRGDGLVGVGISQTSLVSAFQVEKNLVGGALIHMNNTNPGSASAGSRAGFYIGEGPTAKAYFGSAGSLSTNEVGGANGVTLMNYQNAPLVLGTNNNERIRITADGLIGIGSASPPTWGRLTVVGKPKSGGAIYGATSTTLTATETFNETAGTFVAYETLNSGVSNTGVINAVAAQSYARGSGQLSNVRGITASANVYPSAADTVAVTHASGVMTAVGENGGTITNGYGVYVTNVDATTGYGILIKDLTATTAYGIFQEGVSDTNVLFGKTRIGGTPGTGTPEANTAFYVSGNAHVNGELTGTKIKAHFQDIAEWVPSSHDLAPGTVVILDPEVPNQVLASSSAYDTSVAGVVSAEPGITLGEEGVGKEQIATTGRVKVRVDATNAPVRIGDLLVTSDIPGTAMRSTPSDFNGRRFHQPGTIIGKALEPLATGMGEILVLLSMQ